ncbi:MAG: GNAT family N-acetyltransferase [Rhizobiales bacterium]|nr:GNAT family N-acetyltransferase [Hyphomicrobiales bacterium]OJU32773.1 MAG: hypothetical protein BGN94_02365 [Rhizobiales bacterium 68-8]
MAASEAGPIEPLGAGDLDACMALSIEAGWNQTADDWRHFIREGRSFGNRAPDGRLVASAAALPYDGPFGFVSMVLVTADWRRRGLATRLVDRCVEELQARGLVPVLDATAAGAEVYRKQGFVGQFGFDRWQGMLPVAKAAAEAAPGADRIRALDAEAAGAGRARLMDDFLGRDGTIAVGDGNGFALARAGRRAIQAGPVVAADETVALGLIDRLFAALAGFVFIDVPQAWRRIGDWLKARGFEIQRSFTRMALGRAEPFGLPARQFAVAGPEFG